MNHITDSELNMGGHIYNIKFRTILSQQNIDDGICNQEFIYCVKKRENIDLQDYITELKDSIRNLKKECNRLDLENLGLRLPICLTLILYFVLSYYYK